MGSSFTEEETWVIHLQVSWLPPAPSPASSQSLGSKESVKVCRQGLLFQFITGPSSFLLQGNPNFSGLHLKGVLDMMTSTAKVHHLLHISSFSCSETGDFNRPEKGGKARQAWDPHRVVTNPTLKGCEEGLPFSAPLTLSGSKLRPLRGGDLKLQLLSRAALQVFCVPKACVLSLTNAETVSKDWPREQHVMRHLYLAAVTDRGGDRTGVPRVPLRWAQPGRRSCARVSRRAWYTSVA